MSNLFLSECVEIKELKEIHKEINRHTGPDFAFAMRRIALQKRQKILVSNLEKIGYSPGQIFNAIRSN